MLPVYVFSAIVGWPFVLLFLFGGGDTDVDGGFDVDADVDVDVDLDFDADAGLDHGGGWAASDFLSLRAVAFFLAFFGLAGIVIDLVGGGTIVTLLIALGVAAFAVALNARLYRFIKQSTRSSEFKVRELRGLPGEVVLPIGEARGRIAVDYGGHRLYFVARPFKDGASFAKGQRVVVIEIDNGTALVSELEALEA